MTWKPRPPGFTKAQRRWILDRDPLCTCPGCSQCHTPSSRPCDSPSTEADHIVSMAECLARGIDPNILDNGRGLCAPCHRVKTEAEALAARTAQLAKLRHPGAR